MRNSRDRALVRTLKCVGPAEITSDNILLSFRVFQYVPYGSPLPDEKAAVPLFCLTPQERGELFVCVRP